MTSKKSSKLFEQKKAEQFKKNSDFTKGSIGEHLRRLALPASVGFFFQVIFNITDTFVAGYLSTDAQAALAFSFPLFFIIITLAVGISQATTGLIGRALGAEKPSLVRYFLGQLTIITMLVGVLIMIFGNLAARSMLESLGGEAIHVELGLEYIVWIYLFAPAFLITMVLSGLLNAYGDTKTFRNALIASSLLNLILDPALAFGWLGLPALGMHGISAATVLTQFLILGWMCLALRKIPIVATVKLKHLKPRSRALAMIFFQAYPPTLNMLAINFGFVINTYFIASIDAIAVAAYGIALRIEQIVLLLTIGLNIGLLAVASQNFGAKQYQRLREVYAMAIRYGFTIVAIGAVLMLVFGHSLIWVFNSDEKIISYGYQYLVTASILGPLYIIAHNSTSLLQAMAKPAMIGVFGIVRLVVLPLWFCWILVIILDFGVKGVWASLIITNILVTIAIAIYTKWVMDKKAPVT